MTTNSPTLSEMRASLAHASDSPWSNYKEADYTPEQWHKACLIHQHVGTPTSKNECKLPIRTPSGELNSNGVHAAAAALAGARGGVQASSEEKAKAARSLMRFYSELGEEAPDSLLKHAFDKHLGTSFDGLTSVKNVLKHYGRKGMRWGIRRTDAQLATSSAKKSDSEDKDSSGASSGTSSTVVSPDALKMIKSSMTPPDALSDQEIREAVNRANMVKQYNQIFSPDPNAQLRTQVEALNLQKQYSQLKAEMAPPTVRQKVSNLIKVSASSYASYMKLDKATGGALSSMVNDVVRVPTSTGGAPKHRGTGRTLLRATSTKGKKK